MFKNNKIEVYDPDTWRPYCHVKDFSRIIIKVLNSDKDQIQNQVYNVGSGKSILELLKSVENLGKIYVTANTPTKMVIPTTIDG